jgi:hypothetical protein
MTVPKSSRQDVVEASTIELSATRRKNFDIFVASKQSLGVLAHRYIARYALSVRSMDPVYRDLMRIVG